LTRIAKNQSYNKRRPFPLFFAVPSFLRVTLGIALLSTLCIFLPVFLASKLHQPIFRLLLFSYLSNIFVIYLLIKINTNKKHRLEFEIRDIQEKGNILSDENFRERKHKAALQEKINRYNNLKEIIDEINKDLDLDYIANRLSAIAFSLLANNRGVCILYLMDSRFPLSLSLFKTKKDDKALVIKAKEGDPLDLWVLRHTSPLLIEDIRKDFRFDLETLEAQHIRPISSLISAPLISNQKMIGILRLDNSLAGFYSQDDLRLLVTICDMGAVALENGQLFQKTRELALHDELTSLYTKRYFFERLKEECKRSARQGSPLSLLMLDIDYFKDYNDNFGHISGDLVLKSLSELIRLVFKDSSCIISRFGGEEFCIIFSSTKKEKAYKMAEDLRGHVEKAKITLRGQERNITVSIGVAAFPADAKDPDELIFKADRAMYEAKQKGRNRVCGV